MNTYEAFWKSQRTVVRADTAYEAQQKAALAFGKRCKRWDVTVVVAAIGDKPVVHSTSSL